MEVQRIVLAPGERAPQVPADTGQVPLEMRVKGLLLAALGEKAQITGRRLRGTLIAVNPAYSHSFGPPIAEFSAVGLVQGTPPLPVGLRGKAARL